MKILQVCNVGQIVGGTAACAWTITRALPHCDHEVAFLGPIRPETQAAFAPHPVTQWERVSRAAVTRSGADLVVLHNTHRSRCETHLPAVSLLYQHSQITPADADLRLFCSVWLADLCGGVPNQVCVQAVPIPPRLDIARDTRALRPHPVVGRICTPQARKWPTALLPFYAALAAQFPDIRWEFVGCPNDLQSQLQSACQGHALFAPASWAARSRLWDWDALLYHNRDVTESFGRTVAEAQRAGCIPIVDRRGGFVEQVPAHCGFLCDAVDDFRAALATICDPGTRWRMSSAARNHADEHFSLERFGSDLLLRFDQAARRAAGVADC